MDVIQPIYQVVTMESDIPMLKSVTQFDYGRRDVFDFKRKYIFVRQVNLATAIRLAFYLIAGKLVKMIGNMF